MSHPVPTKEKPTWDVSAVNAKTGKYELADSFSNKEQAQEALASPWLKNDPHYSMSPPPKLEKNTGQ